MDLLREQNSPAPTDTWTQRDWYNLNNKYSNGIDLVKQLS